MKTFDDELIGLLAVERVPFFALNEEMLQTLNLLVSYYVDGLDARKLAAEIQSEFLPAPTILPQSCSGCGVSGRGR